MYTYIVDENKEAEISKKHIRAGFKQRAERESEQTAQNAENVILRKQV